MSLPRRVLAGTTYLITRRCFARTMLLKPTRQVTRNLRYLLSLYAERYGIQLHAYVFESTHFHLVATDPRACLPEFMRDLDSVIARSLNRVHRRGEWFWAPGSYNRVVLPDAVTVLEAISYVILNPVADGLVSRPERWPGLISRVEHLGVLVLRARRPREAFYGGRRPAAGRSSQPASSSKLPDRVRVRLTLPPAFADSAIGAFQRQVRELVAQGRERILQERRREGKRRFLGARAILRADPCASLGDVSPTFERVPHLKPGRDPARRKARIAELRAWRDTYREQLVLWIAGNRDVEFPAGSYWVVVFHGARVMAQAPPAQAPPSVA